MLNPRENYMQLLLHKETEYVPCALTDTVGYGFGNTNGPWFEKGPEGGGYDGFGVRWETPSSGNGAAVPAPNDFILDDITEWESLKFPDLDSYDWKGESEKDLSGLDRTQKVVDFGVGNGVFERLVAVMGFEEALVSIMLEPEACMDFFNAVADYEIRYIEYIHEYYHPDQITYYDDIATQRNLFMAPDQYREMIKPYHKKVYDAIHDMGMYVVQHTCGHAEMIVPDMIEIGVDMWTSVQPMNDIEALIQEYGDQFSFSGGYDTNGPCAGENATPEQIIQETHRVVDTYGKYNKAYCLFAFFLNNNPEIRGRNFGILFGEFLKYRMEAAKIPAV